MVNESEEKVRKIYETLGFTVVHRGAPDFLIFKRDNHGHMVNIEFVEVKPNVVTPLTDEQKLWMEALDELYCPNHLFSPDVGIHAIPREETANIYCVNCRKNIQITKGIIYEQLRKMRGEKLK